MSTGKKPASDASRILDSKNSTAQEKEVAASDLSQRRGADKPEGKRKGEIAGFIFLSNRLNVAERGDVLRAIYLLP
jgi:hypothetical protein